MKYNENFKKLPKNYIFNQMAQKVEEKKRRGDKNIINLGVGDVKLPLFNCVIEEMKKASDEMGNAKTFKGYSPAEGYEFLREKIAREYNSEKVLLTSDEIFITDGAKSQLGNVLELFGFGASVLFLTPCYPAGAEACILYGNSIEFLKGGLSNGFFPSPPYGKSYDVIYICSPNNPTGEVISYQKLSEWVTYALKTQAVIIYDSAYSSYVSGDFPKSVYQIKDAKKCAIEINSFSKSLGFTGVRCGYTVVPNELGDYNERYKRWLGCRFNGVSYITQRGAFATFCEIGRNEIKKRINFYKTNVEILKIALKNKNLWYNNSICSPYVFAKVPNGKNSMAFCCEMLEKISVVATPGSGFLDGGEGFFRLSGFATRDEILQVADRLSYIN